MSWEKESMGVLSCCSLPVILEFRDIFLGKKGATKGEPIHPGRDQFFHSSCIVVGGMFFSHLQ